MNTPGFLLCAQFRFALTDLSYTESDRVVELVTPEESYDLAALLRDFPANGGIVAPYAIGHFVGDGPAYSRDAGRNSPLRRRGSPRLRTPAGPRRKHGKAGSQRARAPQPAAQDLLNSRLDVETPRAIFAHERNGRGPSLWSDQEGDLVLASC
jgi:hypothetical protein